MNGIRLVSITGMIVKIYDFVVNILAVIYTCIDMRCVYLDPIECE